MFWLRNKKIIFQYTLLSGGLANSAVPDEMLCYEAFHQGIHCLLSTCLLVFRMKMVNLVILHKSFVHIHKIRAIEP